jgi:ankyrin repeat protein
MSEYLKRIYSAELHRQCAFLKNNHLTLSGDRIHQIVRIVDLLDEHLKDVFFRRMDYVFLWWLQIHVSGIMLSCSRLDRYVEKAVDQRHKEILDEHLEENKDDLSEVLYPILLQLPMNEQLTSEEIVRMLAKRDAYELLLRMIVQACEAYLNDNPNCDILCPIFNRRCEGEGVDVFFLRKMMDDIGFVEQSMAEQDECFNRFIRWLNRLQSCGVVLDSLTVANVANGQGWMTPVPHYFWSVCYKHLPLGNRVGNRNLLRYVPQLFDDVPTLSPGVKDMENRNLLHLTAFYKDSYKESYMYKELCKKDNELFKTKDKHGNTPLHILAQTSESALDIFLKNTLDYSDFHTINNNGDTPLVIALMRFDVSAIFTVDSLLSFEKKLETTEQHEFDLRKYKQCIHKMVRHGAPLLHIQKFLDHYPQVKKYVVYRFPTQRNSNVLEWACLKGRMDILHYLFQEYPSCLFECPVEEEFADICNPTDVSMTVTGERGSELAMYIMGEMNRSIVNTGLKVTVFRHVLDEARKNYQSTMYMSACLCVLLDMSDFETLLELFMDPYVCQSQELRVCLADYRDPSTFETYFQMIAKQVVTDVNGGNSIGGPGRTTTKSIKNSVGFQVLYYVCKYGANPMRGDNTTRNMKLLPDGYVRLFEPFRHNVTLEGLVNEYEENGDPVYGKDKIGRHFEDPVSGCLMRCPVFLLEDSSSHTYDLKSLKNCFRYDCRLPLTRQQVPSSVHYEIDWVKIHEMRAWLQSVIYGDPQNEGDKNDRGPVSQPSQLCCSGSEAAQTIPSDSSSSFFPSSSSSASTSIRVLRERPRRERPSRKRKRTHVNVSGLP